MNVVALGRLLELHDPGLPWYLGKTSTASALRIVTADQNTTVSPVKSDVQPLII